MSSAAIVIDIGSGYCKAGFAGEESPSSVFPTIIGVPRHKGFIIGAQSQDSYAGNQALSKIGILNIQYPVKSGFIMNWNDLTKILSSAYQDELHSNSNEHPVLLTDSIRSDQKQREKMTQVVFETFQVPSFCVCKQSFLSIYSTGQKTGLSIDIGHEITQIVPVHEFQTVRSGISCLNFGGSNQTILFLRALRDRGFELSAITGNLIASDIKEKYGYVSLDYQNEKSQEITYQSEDGDEFKVGDERFQCPELFFNPNLGSLDNPSIQNAANDSIMKCDSSIRNQLFNNIVICGGSSMFDGFAERFEKEINQIAKSSKINIVAPENRAFSTWIGGSMFASSDDFASSAVNKAEYEEQGSKIVCKLNL